MRKTLLISAIALLSASADVSAFDINVAVPGTFKDLIIDTEEDISTLTISGTMDASDVEYLTGNTGKITQVQHLIIGDLSLVESEDVPYRSFSIFSEAGGGEQGRFFYSKNARVEAQGYTSGLGMPGVIYMIYGTDLAGLLAKTQFPKITLPEKATKVPDYMCFQCFNTQEIVISDDVEEIGKLAFKECSTLSSINSPSKLKIIGESAFEWTAFSSFVLPCHPVEIRDRAFRISYQLQNINLENVPYIGDNAFVGTGLTNLDLSGTSVIGANAFEGCPIKELVVSDRLRVIGDCAFSSPYGGNNFMKTLVLFEGLESIGKEAFYNTQLNNVNIPSTVTFIGQDAFGRTPWDSSLNTTAEGGVVYLGNIAYKSVNRPETIVFKDGTVSISANLSFEYTKSITLPSSVRSIYACNGMCDKLEYLSLNEGLIIIGDNVFNTCPNLKEVTLPSTLEYIGSGAFCYAGITSLKLPDSLKGIKGDGAFGGSKITSLTLPYGLEELGSYTFMDCKSLSTVRLNSRSLRYDGYYDDGKGNYGSGGFLSGSGVEKIIIGKEVETIPSGLFGNVGDNLARVEFEDSDVPLEIGNIAIRGGYGTPAKVIGNIDRVTSIGEWSLSNLSFPFGTHFEMPNMKSLAAYAFNEVDGVTSMTLNKDVKIHRELGSLPDLRILNYDIPTPDFPESYHSITLLYFSNPLDTLTIGPNVEIITKNLFSNSQVRNIIFSPREQTRAASTLSIGYGAFFGSQNLTSIDFPKELTSIGQYAFNECSNLSTVYFHGNDAPIVGSDAIPRAATLYVPAESEQLYQVNMPQNKVVPYRLESVMFDKSVLGMFPGDSYYLIPRIAPAECSEMGLTWSSSDPSVATVSQRGDVVAVGFGTAIVTATIALDNTFKAECIVNVTDPNGVDLIDSETSQEKEYFTLDGLKINRPTAPGIYILKSADGTVVKIQIK